jgi:glycosidase
MATNSRDRSPGGAAPAAVAIAMALTVASCGSSATPTPASSGPASSPAASTSSGASASTGTTTCAAPAALPWWNDRVFYEVFVRSFQDSDGDGIGDLKGLTSRLDYLNDGDPATTTDLGVTGLWLMPVAESPSYHGYDVTDYTKVEPDYGTAADFRALVDAAHKRGIAVIPDLVLNHTSVEHPWFVDSETKGSPHADWYLWSDTDPGITRTDGTQVWHQKDGRWYYGYFWEGMPDLNLANPAVTAELEEDADVWLQDMGVDGFRLDAIRYYVEDGAQLEDLPASKTWLAAFREHVLLAKKDALLVGEAYTDTKSAASWLPAADITFDFGYATAMLTAVKSYSATAAKAALQESLAAYPPGQRGVFLTNHDQPRVMAELADTALARTAAELLLTSSGVPFVYYGEEVGLDGTKPDEGIRTPMPWTAKGPGVGFTTGTPWEAPSAGFETANVASEGSVPTSLLSTYRTLIRLRGAHSALSRGDATVLDASDEAVLAVVRQSADETVLVMSNLGITDALAPTVDLSPVASCVGGAATALYGGATVTAPAGDLAAYRPVDKLGPGQTLVIGLGG